MSATTVRLERRDGVSWLTLDRSPLNVLDIAMLRDLADALDAAAADGATRVLVIRGAGRAFCAGADVNDHLPGRVEEMLPLFHEVIGRVLAQEVPVVAAVSGAALGGGCELALACDIILARRDARFGQPEITLGAFPPAAAVLLPRRIGPEQALELILTGRLVGAVEARELGLAHRVFSPERFDDDVAEYVAGLAALSRPVLRLAKAALRRAAELPVRDALDGVESLYLNELVPLADASEGLAAFLEKRPPVWRDA